MNDRSSKAQQTVIGQLRALGKYLFGVIAANAILCSVSYSDPEQATAELVIDPAIGQAVFGAPGDAANAFHQALVNHDTTLLGKVFGTDYREILPLDDVDIEDVNNFIAAWDTYNTLLPEGEQKVLIAVGKEKWTLPVPIVETASGWHFDMEEGVERMRIRRIGRNELAAIQAVLAYYDAQMEYASQDRNGDGLLEYAQQFISTSGTRDGLYWEAGPGEPLSPLGPLMADHEPGGGYHGYFYRILNAQGEHANGGARNYLIGDRMMAGFAAIAWPEEYGETGVMSFLVSHAGIVYEQDLGPDGASIAKEMLAYDPGPGWTPVQEVNGPQASDTQ